MSLTRACSLVVALGGIGCQEPTEPASAVALDPSAFAVVSEMLGASCGSLDCHGQRGRPLRLHHRYGLRLAPDAIPGTGVTTQGEHDSNLRAVVGLEPELTSQVIRDAGKSPDRLTLVRKARGLEEHTGGTPLPEGSDGDVCLLSWLASSTVEAACERAAELARPE